MPVASDLESLYDAHAQALFGFLLNLTRSEEDTRDLIQDLFLKLGRQPSLLEGMREPRAYLLRLVHNAAIDLFRRRASRDKYQVEAGEGMVEIFAPADDPDEAAFRNALADGMDELPPEQRAVVHLKLWEDLTFDDIARILDISINTAGSRYRYALDKLRQHLRPLYDETR